MTISLRDQLQAALGEAYIVDRELGGGGMSRVFVATETALGRQVVVKVLPGEMLGQVSADRFKREISLAAQLQHPHIVPLLTAGDAGGLPYFTMPFIRGESLRIRIAQHGELPVSDAVRILREVASALAFAHAQGVVHRDIKPDNVLLSGGAAMVTDFGVAKALSASTTTADSQLTSLGVALGTPAYMSPEQASADPLVDHRADVYAWGIMAYELLSGSTPFAGRPGAAMLAAHVTTDPEPIARRRPAIPSGLAELVMRCLEKRPADRPQSADELVRALDAIGTPTSGSQPAGVPTLGFGRRVGRSRRVVAVLGGAVGIAAIASLLLARARDDTHLRTIAVVPVVVAGLDTAREYVSDGIADDLTAALLQVHELSVINRSSANAFKAKTINTREAAQTLGVDHVIELTVRSTVSGVRVNADVVHATDGVVTWSKTFESDRNNLSLLGDQIATAIVAGLHVGAASGPSIRRRRQPTPEAYDAYLRQRFFADRFASKRDFDSAVVYFQRAVAADSNFAAPYATAALMYTETSGSYDLSVQPAYARSNVLARRAITLDPSNAEAHAILGSIEIVLDWNWVSAQRELERAVALDPSSAVAHLYYSLFWMARGDLDRAVGEARDAVHLDPYHSFGAWILMFELVATNRPDSAIAVQRQIDGINPGFFALESFAADAYREKGQLDTALVLDRAATKVNGWPTSGLVVSLAALGRRAEAELAYREMVAASRRQVVLNELLGRAALAAGHRNEALAWLEKAMLAHSDFMLMVRYYPDMRPLMSDPAYLHMLDHIGLPH